MKAVMGIFKKLFAASRSIICCIVALSVISVRYHVLTWEMVLLGLTVSIVAYLIIDAVFGAQSGHTDGTLMIDQSDPDKNIYRFDWVVDPNNIVDHQVVKFKIDRNANLSRK